MALQNRMPLENVHWCAGCAKKGKETMLTGAQAAKTLRELKMKLCPACRRFAKAYIAKRRESKTIQPPEAGRKGMARVMEYSKRFKEAKTTLEVDEIVLDLAADPAATKVLIETVSGLAHRRRSELKAGHA